MISFHADALETMNADLVRSFPDEGCGFLFGTENNAGDRIISKAREVINAKQGDKKRRFEITARDYLRAELFADENRLQLLGIYHSHPQHPAIPSETDRVAAQPFFSYVIVSVMQGLVADIRSWRLTDHSDFQEEVYSPIYINQI